MKYLASRALGMAICGFLIFTSCSKTKTVTMSTMRPAEITFPSYVNTLVLIDRAKPDKKALDIIEGVFTGELPGEDKSGVQATLQGLRETILTSPRFQIKLGSERLKGNSLTAAFPSPLDWGEINNICENYGADAVVAVEIFDSDFVVTDGVRKVTKIIEVEGQGDKKEKKEIEVDEFFAQGIGNTKIGIRMYDPRERNIVDQQLFNQTNTWQAVGANKQDALASLIAKSDATRYLARQVGSNYAYKIAPMPVRISRPFYKKSKHVAEVAIGARKADVNDWEGAAETWERALATAPSKESGYLTYNIAIAYEVLGDYETAITWAQRSYVDYDNKKARGYVSALEDRIWQEQRVNEQMR